VKTKLPSSADREPISSSILIIVPLSMLHLLQFISFYHFCTSPCENTQRVLKVHSKRKDPRKHPCSTLTPTQVPASRSILDSAQGQADGTNQASQPRASSRLCSAVLCAVLCCAVLCLKAIALIYSSYVCYFVSLN
jgi:hypothetical protein